MFDSPISLRFLEANRARQSTTPSPLEQEVVALFNELRTPLLRYALSLGLPLQDGEEVVQDVFVALFQHLRKDKPRSNLRGWVFRVGHNLALKQRMRNGRRNRLECEAEAAGLSHDPGPDPEQHVAQEQRRRHLLNVVEALPETDRCCIYLRAEGLRYREISEVLGISLGGVALSLSRSLARLGKVEEQ
jgi:RNA polymerase sigma-70 factor (ECF subfamily)